MNLKRSCRIISIFLAALIVASAFSVFSSADEIADDDNVILSNITREYLDSNNNSSASSLKETVNAVKYANYIASKKAVASYATDEIVIKATEYDRELSSSVLEEYGEYNGVSDVILTDNVGNVSYRIEVEKAALYTFELDYASYGSSSTSIERTLLVNGTSPFSEARYLQLKKGWAPAYTEQEDGTMRFQIDMNNNELRPSLELYEEWQHYTFVSSDGFQREPLRIYLAKGENIITIKSVREGCYIANIKLGIYEAPPSYQDVLAQYEKNGYKYTDKTIYFEAETPTIVSDYSINPINDKVSPATSPQSPSSTKYNTIGAERYKTVGQWIEWEFEVEESGVYSIATRFRQNISAGVYTSRKLLIDGKVPYDAASNIRFPFNDNWQVDYLSDENGQLKFYLEKGKHILRLEVTLGDMTELVSQIYDIQTSLNNDYLQILRLTGADPDAYRDYGFSRVLPDVLKDLVVQGRNLKTISEYIEKNNESSEITTTINQVSDLILKMGTDEDNVAGNLATFQTYLGTLGSYVSSLSDQPLELDYLLIQSPEAKLPAADSGFFESIAFEIQQFFFSFFVDYNSLGTASAEESSETLEIWCYLGRDQAQIVKTLIDNYFTPAQGIPVSLKIADGGALIPSIFAGTAPDVNLATGSVIDYALRGAYRELETFEDFKEVESWFPEVTFQPHKLFDPKDYNIEHVYGLPTSFDFSMLFYRTDILATLNLDIPQTWDDLMAIIPVLQYNNMDIGASQDLYRTFLYQNGGYYWADYGMRVNFDSQIFLESFEDMCNLYTQYSLPLAYDATNRFRTGEIPLFISSYGTYNNITVFAPELTGMWDFTLIPGTKMEDGTLNRAEVGGSAAIGLLSASKNYEDAWKFLKWYVNKDFQVDFSNELIAILGDAAKPMVACIDSLEELAWTRDQADILRQQASEVVCITDYPGTYFVARYLTFSINSAYNEGEDPAQSILGYINAINKEISRKRKEFGYETLDLGQTLAKKRLGEGIELLNEMSESDISKYDSQIKAIKSAVEAENYEEVRSAADSLMSSNSSLFSEACDKFYEAASLFASYH